MAQIDIKNLTFAYDGSYDNIFDDVSFRLDTDWRLGFVGRNGRGKTTLLNLLMGKFKYSGTISAKFDFEYFPYVIPDKTLNTIDIAESLSDDFELWRLERELSYLNLDDEILYRPFNTLSNGERTKVLLAILFLNDNKFLLIDEPTNHLDYEGRQVVGEYLKSKKGFILVSHDRAFLDNCVDHILSINKADIEVRRGEFSSWYNDKLGRDEAEIAQNERLKKEIKRLDSSMKKAAARADKIEGDKYGIGPVDKGYIGHKSAKMMQLSKNIENRYGTMKEEKSGLLKNIDEAEDLKIRPLKHHSQNLFTFENVDLFYGDKRVCAGLNFTVNRGEMTAIRGSNGSGKSTVLKLLCGEDIKHTGNLYKSGNIVISYVPQDTSSLKGSLSAYARENKIDETLFKTILRKLDFSRVQFEKNIEDYSQGQKKKVLIARSLCEQAHLYVWDEPLNFVDIMSRIQIESLLLKFRPAMVFVEHDKTFTDKIADKVITL